MARGYSLVGICLIRLECFRLAGLPGTVGLASENAVHRIAVEWADSTQAEFPVRLRIITEDRPGMIAGISNIISETGANIRTFESGGDDSTRARIEVALDVRDRKQLEHIIGAIKRLPGVFDIERVYNV